MPQQSKNYVFTYYPTPQRENERTVEGRDDHFEYVAYGEETCPNTGRKHFQGYCVFKRRKTLNSAIPLIQKMYPAAHVEIMRGRLKDSEEYCSKEGSLITWGVPPQQGCRKDLAEIADAINNDGKTADDILEEDPMAYHQYGRTIEKLEAKKMKQLFRKDMTEGLWLYGPTGTGKSRTAFENFNPETHYVFSYASNAEWWDGYNPLKHKIVIFDEFRGQLPFNRLLQLCDQHPTKVNVKGTGAIPFLAEKIIITSCAHPREIYKDILTREESIDQLNRRFNIQRMGPAPMAPIFHPTTPVPSTPTEIISP